MSERQREPHNQERKKGGRIILPALCGIVGTLIIVLVIAALLPTTLSRFMGFEVYNVVSGSMAPSIPVGSMVFVKPTDWQEIEAGDVIAYESGGSVVTHRVKESRFVEGDFVTKGDANENEDLTAVPYSALIGRVEWSVPYLGEIMSIASTPLGKIYMFAFLLCGVLFNVLAGRLRED